MRLLVVLVLLSIVSSTYSAACLVTGYKNITEQYVQVNEEIYVFYIAKLYVTVYTTGLRSYNSTARESYNKRYPTTELAIEWQNKYAIGVKYKCWMAYRQVVFSKDGEEKMWMMANIILLVMIILTLIPCIVATYKLFTLADLDLLP